jgi:hypothetical protein
MPMTRKRGRPRAREPRSSVSTWITQREHDRLCRIAIRRGVSVSSLVRRVLVLGLSSTLPQPQRDARDKCKN